MKYYFVYYSCYRINWPANLPANSNTTFNQALTVEHPISWQIGSNELYDKRMSLGSGEYSEHYQVISWQELTEAEYIKFNGLIG